MTLPLTWLGCGSLHRRKEDPLAEAAGGGLAWFTCGLQWTPELPWCPADIRCQLRASWEAGCCTADSWESCCHRCQVALHPSQGPLFP